MIGRKAVAKMHPSPEAASYPADSMLGTLLLLLKLKNPKIYAHSYQVANYAVSIAAKMRLPKEEIERIRIAATLHDIGLLSVPNYVIEKVPYLSTRELSLYKSHCLAGASMLENIPEFEPYIPYIRHHHEQWDGKGYPKRLKGVNIALGARIIAVANHYDRFINPCVQNWSKTKKEAIRELYDLSGTVLDTEIVKAFVNALG